MRNPIGIIDSGVGGLTVAKEVMRQLPNESIVYLGDGARCPYGPRPVHEVKKFTWELTNYVLKFDIKMLIIACNTATAVVLEDLKKELPIPVLGVIHPGARAAIKNSRKYHIGVIGTEGTISSKAYEYALKTIRSNVQVNGIACPKFVPLVESGVLQGPIAERIVHESLYPLKKTNIDTLILGCTHYPLLEPLIKSELGESIKIISSGEETAREASAILDHLKLLNVDNSHVNHHFYTTGSKILFEKIAKSWLPCKELNIETISIS